MSLDQDAEIAAFFASAPQDRHVIATLEFSHSDMPQTYHLWREPYDGQTTLEDESVVDMLPVNFAVKLPGSPNNLDQQFQVDIDTTDITDEFRNAIDAVPVDSAERIQMVYREYLSTDLATPLTIGVVQVESVTWKMGVATISAVSPRLNSTRTGEIYDARSVPMLRTFV